MPTRRRVANEADTLIIGAGAAGLAAAAELSSHDVAVTVLDARERIGGRIFTGHDSVTPVPIEFGAEFIHGKSPSVLGWLKAANLAAIDASQKRFTLERGRLQPGDDVFEAMRKRLERIGKPRQDMPFAEFLARHTRQLTPQVREFARMLVEGFDAADATRVSTYEVLEEWSGSAAADAPTFRPLQGYDSLIRAIQKAFKPDRVHLRLGTLVRQIAWKRGAVEVEALQYGEPIRIQARRAIIALPLGVLQLPSGSPHAVRFDPPLRQKAAAFAHLAVGPVIKVMLRFARPFWEELEDGKFNDVAFFHAPKAAFPTFWTSLPVRSPVLVAWAAGPNALRLEGSTPNEILEHALNALRTLFGPRANYRADLEGFAYHDWQRDPLACGAYSYVLANGRSARARLARSIDDTLFFAGEAADTQGEAAAVGGALQSGKRAALQVIGR